MDPFYSIVIIVAIVFLILALIAVGMALQKQGKKDPFPRLQAVCPDGWAMTDTHCIINSLNKGTVNTQSTSYPMGTNASSVWSPGFARNPAATLCDKRKWALNNGIAWDGVSNYNQCV